MKELKIRGGVVKLDDDMYEFVKNIKWHVARSKSQNKYVCSSINTGIRCKECGLVKHKIIKLHHLLIGKKQDMVVDHINGDGLDNRRENLRLATKGQNNINRKTSSNSKTGYKGVQFKKQNSIRPYMARLRYEGRDYFGGYYKTAEEAARSYDELAIKIHGEYARTNFPNNK